MRTKNKRGWIHSQWSAWYFWFVFAFAWFDFLVFFLAVYSSRPWAAGVPVSSGAPAAEGKEV